MKRKQESIDCHGFSLLTSLLVRYLQWRLIFNSLLLVSEQHFINPQAYEVFDQNGN